ncbi:unnamed protein product [Heterobilharzia americana]|nr:unnamed protein product [Heterobilharzia americana]
MDLLPTVYTNRMVCHSDGNSVSVNGTNPETIGAIHEDGDQEDGDDQLSTEYRRSIYGLHHPHHHQHHHQHQNHHHHHTAEYQYHHGQIKLPPHLSALPNPLYYYLHSFYINRVETRRQTIAKTLREIVQIAQEILHEVELQEPRFISTLKVINTGQLNSLEMKQQIGNHDNDDENQSFSTNANTTNNNNSSSSDNLNKKISQNGIYYDGLRVLSSNHFEITLYLNQMGVFNFMDDGSVPGGAVLKLSDGRKRSMSLWVEFITASGYLSARKIRSRFHSLVGQAVQKSTYRGIVRMLGQTSEVKLCIRDKYILQITPGFRCNGLWPRSASHWPTSNYLQNGINTTINTNSSSVVVLPQ